MIAPFIGVYMLGALIAAIVYLMSGASDLNQGRALTALRLAALYAVCWPAVVLVKLLGLDRTHLPRRRKKS